MRWVYLDADAISGETFSSQTRVAVYPGADLLTPDGDLRDDLTVDVSPAASADSLTFARGTRVGSQPVSLYADGDIRQWPFDTYQTSDVQLLAFTGTGGARVAVPVQVVVTDSVTSWAVHARASEFGPAQALDIHVARTGPTIGFAIAMCAVLLILPICTLFVSIQTLRERKQFLPPIGSWVDYTVVLWVVIGLATSLALYVTAWWRQAP